MSENKFTRPQVVVSKCLGFAACRWNQAMVEDPFVEKLKQFVDYHPVCPEMEIGLGVPRDPVRLVGKPEAIKMIQPATGRDCTREMQDFMADFFGSLKEVDGFLLKGRSPSCGPMDVAIYASEKPGSSSKKGAGMFAAKARETAPLAAMEHEGRVKNFELREHFLTKMFTMAWFRQVRKAGSMGALVDFHSKNKLLFMGYNQSRMRIMGKLVANPQGDTLDKILDQYEDNLGQTLAKAPKTGSIINVLMHAEGYFKKQLTAREKAHFLDNLDLFRQGRALLSSLQMLLFDWILRYDQEYLAEQSFFAPYPQELFYLKDSGKGRTVS
jgi:uncharacterized protein YbgA (DUF1722 family)/uncharacterized protein YbbK (DUF523 family)